MAKYLVETYYTSTFKVTHYLDDINEAELKNLEKRDDGKFEVLEIKLDNRKTKNELIKLINNQEYIYKDLSIKSIKCTDSEFDDNPEIKAYIQVRDLTKKDRNNVFVFNGWMFSSSPSIAPFDHPVYDIWLINCY